MFRMFQKANPTKMKKTKPSRFHFLLAAAVAFAGSASAATLTWTAGGAGNWDTDARWGGTEPVSGDFAIVNNGNTVTANMAGEIAGRLDVTGGSTVQVNAGDLTLNAVSQSASLNVNSGTLNVAGGAVSVTGVVNNFLQGGGAINVSAGSVTHTAANLRFGDGASTGSLSVSGTGSWSSGQLVIVGNGSVSLTGSSAQIINVNINNNQVAGTLTFNLTPGSAGINAVGATNMNLTRPDTLNFFTDNLNSGDQMVDIFNYSGSLTSTFNTVNVISPTLGTLALGSDPSGNASNLNAGEYWIDYGTGTSSSITMLYNIPEPSPYGLAALGALALLGLRRRSA